MKDTLENTNDSLLRLLGWIDQNGWKGWDPYDLKSLKWVIKIAQRSSQHSFYIYLRELLYEIFYQFPLISRKVLGVKPEINAKAIGLFASAYLDLYKSTGKQEYLDSCHQCVDWLLKNPSPVEKGLGWGYPFDWQSTLFIPAHTPNGIVTTAAGNAIWELYKYTGEQKYLDKCLQIGEFLSSLPLDELSENKICFSYTPLFVNHVHNLNLFVAEFLLKAGMEINREDWIQTANMAINYTIADQKKDGSFDYNGPPEKSAGMVDNYHSGFAIRMLHSIWKIGGREDVFSAMDKCYIHYTESFFENGTIPKLLPNRKYRIDIHSCAESILCISQLSETFPAHQELSDRVLNWTLQNLQDKTGFFYYGILKSRLIGCPFKSKIAYIRWSQAWMLKALAYYSLGKTKLYRS